ncbi:molybdopterin-dependent oxidoreductase [Halomonas sp. B23F22_10]|uniref:molybdopterin-dependent oxidoreductase n=1 Tax=Halomonas sp. B23F22_10 TaxID=3459515 RepID=UPI00373EB73A
MMLSRRLALSALLAAALWPALSTAAEPVLDIHAHGETRHLSLEDIERSDTGEVTMRHFEGPEGTFSGVWLNDFLADQNLDEASRLRFIALDDYTSFLTPADREGKRFLLATRLDGTPLTPDNLGPLMLVVPADAEAVLKGDAPMSQWIWSIDEIQAR